MVTGTPPLSVSVRAAPVKSVTACTSSATPHTSWADAVTAATTSDMVTRRPSACSEVTGRSAIPHGTMWPNMARSQWTLSAKPWVVRPRDVRTPTAAILPRTCPGRFLVQTHPHTRVAG